MSLPESSFRRGMLAAATACVLAVGAALFAQYALDMRPCPWCILQRLLFVAIAVVALLAAALRGRAVQKVLGSLAAVLAVAGIAAAVHQHTVAAKSVSCNLTFADKVLTALQLETLLPSVFGVTASCAEAAVDLLGLPFEFWSLAAFALIGAGCALLVARR